MGPRPEPIAIVGAGCRFPGNAASPSKLWDLVRQPRDLLSKIPADRFDVDGLYHPDPDHHGTTNVQSSYFLSEDIRRFDAGFFNVSAAEAEAMDPQVRLLLETVYEAISEAGQTIEGLQGSSTGVYVGLMCADYAGILGKDYDVLPTYTVTTAARCMPANRISYFFDWHGPSMVVDTACSSSLVAIHLATQALRSGESRVAVATGTNLLLSPDMYIWESKLHMLGSTGRCQMWDANVDGYGRGEGVAAVVLKTLSAALEDGDHIECIIRESGINQDGRTTGITMPNNLSQTALISDTYARAGLDPQRREDRPQFFHAHGTGTAAGDPQEAEAIYRAFSCQQDDLFPEGPMYVGSVKTVIGHTEGTAGLASVLSTSLALKHGVIPPNMHFNKLSEKVAPFYHNLEIATEATPWPLVPSGQPRRASINSFGFGGANAHVILEAYDNKEQERPHQPLSTPLVFSAASERTLRATLAQYSAYLKSNPFVDLRALAWTLQKRRSELATKATFSGRTTKDIFSKIDSSLAKAEGSGDQNIGFRSTTKVSHRILGVFTGQGAQWPMMGRHLILTSSHVRGIVDNLDKSLQDLPEADRPSWSISDELMANPFMSKVAQAQYSQPLCTAVQIILVDLLRSAGVEFAAVVGHSSGEIGAAYAAGFLSASDAIRIAYYRGFHVKLAAGSTGRGSAAKGAMVAVGTTPDDAEELCSLRRFRGKLVLAACNSPSSITLSGDKDAVDRALLVMEDEKKFARALKVDTAYHSFHMMPCSKPYLDSLDASGVTSQSGEPTTAWFSSVHSGKRMRAEDVNNSYWVDNMVHPVLFSQAITAALVELGPFDVALEVGPHPALKGPALANMDAYGGPIPYCGLLGRGKNDVVALSESLGFLWCHLGGRAVDLNEHDRLMTGDASTKLPLKGLPAYPWDHERVYWAAESRAWKAIKNRTEAPHDLLGNPTAESTPREPRWKNVLRPKELSWLNGHRLQGQTVFPAAGYVAMALEAAQHLAPHQNVSLFEIRDFDIARAVTFDDDNSAVETLFTMNVSEGIDADSITAEFRIYTCTVKDDALGLVASGGVFLELNNDETRPLPGPGSQPSYLNDVEKERFYSALSKLGYDFSGPFQSIEHFRRKGDFALATLGAPPRSQLNTSLLLHPVLLDGLFQTAIAAYNSPGDGRMWSIHVPTTIKRLSIDPASCRSHMESETSFSAECTITKGQQTVIQADAMLVSADKTHAIVQVEAITMVPFSRATPADDSLLFSTFAWGPMDPDGVAAVDTRRATTEEIDIALDLDRIALYYLKHLHDTITPEESAAAEWHHRSLLRYAAHVVEQVESGVHPSARPEWRHDTHDQIREILQKYPSRVDARIQEAVGEHMPAVIRGETTILEHMLKDGLFDSIYRDGLGCKESNRWIANMVKQLCHRYPHMKIIEIGAGTGGATRSIIEALGMTFSSYTYTDISSGFFEKAQEVFHDVADKMVFKTLDVEKDIATQGYADGSYDLVVASNVLHATKTMEKTLKNTRRLLKPGGYLLLLEVTNNVILRNGQLMGGLPGWWLGEEDGRPFSPTISSSQWDSLLRQTGFSGIDTITPENDPLPYPFSVFISQAVDERVDLLRNPLQATSVLANMSQLVVLGGTSSTGAKLADETTELLASHSKSLVRVNRIEDLKDHPLQEYCTVVNLGELDEPLFRDLTRAKHEGLQSLFSKVGNMLWVTQGCRSDQPYSNMVLGLARSIHIEQPNVRLQMLDFDSALTPDASIIASALLRLCTSTEWAKKQADEDLLSVVEPELAIDQHGKFQVCRLIPRKDQNNRYNSTRREISRSAHVASSPVELVHQGQTFDLKQLAVTPNKVTAMQTVNISLSTLYAIEIKSAGQLFLCYGTEADTGRAVICLSETNSSVVHVPSSLILDGAMVEDPAQTLLALAANLASLYMVSMTPRRGTLMVHEPLDFLLEPVRRRAKAEGKTVVFSVAKQPRHPSRDILYLHPRSTKNAVRAVVPQTADLLFDMSSDLAQGNVRSHVATSVPPRCKTKDLQCVFGQQAALYADDYHVSAEMTLKVAWADTAFGISKFNKENTPTIVSLTEVGNAAALSPGAVVDWNVSEVPISIEPVHEAIHFRPDRTYLLVGMTGELGRSLCEWMVARGARSIAIGSRHPQIAQGWLDEMSRLGADIHVFALDVTNKSSLESAYDTMCKTLPPIAGVANAAMVLDDILFSNMDYESMAKVLRPKVQGSQNLDELFAKDNKLDFFIMFSSLAYVLGNRGQSNYVAANAFMTSLAKQRKRRGQAASIIHLSAITGIGYVEHSQLEEEHFRRIGFNFISEYDFLTIFAEGIVSGQSSSVDDVEICSGVLQADAAAELKFPWQSNPIYSHFIQEKTGVKVQQVGSTTTVAVKVQLAAANNVDQARDIIRDALKHRIRLILQIPGEDEVAGMVPLVDLGVDSLVAVEVRSWFLAEVDVDMPVLKLLSGASIEDLVVDAVEKLPAELLSGTASGESAMPATTRQHWQPAGNVGAASKPTEAESLAASARAGSTTSESHGHGDQDSEVASPTWSNVPDSPEPAS